MKTLVLRRVASGGDGTFGVLVDDGVPFAVTCERPWYANKKFISCIPEGTYVCQRTVSHRFGETFEITGVRGRSNILFHKGNVMADSQGCILVGEQFESLGGRTAVLQSGKGFGEFMSRLKGVDGFMAIIRDA